VRISTDSTDSVTSDDGKSGAVACFDDGDSEDSILYLSDTWDIERYENMQDFLTMLTVFKCFHELSL
jgi:hypothetical protein